MRSFADAFATPSCDLSRRHQPAQKRAPPASCLQVVRDIIHCGTLRCPRRCVCPRRAEWPRCCLVSVLERLDYFPELSVRACLTRCLVSSSGGIPSIQVLQVVLWSSASAGSLRRVQSLSGVTDRDIRETSTGVIAPRQSSWVCRYSSGTVEDTIRLDLWNAS